MNYYKLEQTVFLHIWMKMTRDVSRETIWSDFIVRDESFNSITGLNGSGKSNILDASCFFGYHKYVAGECFPSVLLFCCCLIRY